jgi:hypothetical protein
MTQRNRLVDADGVVWLRATPELDALIAEASGFRAKIDFGSGDGNFSPSMKQAALAYARSLPHER